MWVHASKAFVDGLCSMGSSCLGWHLQLDFSALGLQLLWPLATEQAKSITFVLRS